MNYNLDNHELTEEQENKCNEVVMRYFSEAKQRTHLPHLQAIQYVEKKTGAILTVCCNGEILYTPKEVGPEVNILAFESGLRSNEEAVKELKTP